jgi:hypothetical protein
MPGAALPSMRGSKPVTAGRSPTGQIADRSAPDRGEPRHAAPDRVLFAERHHPPAGRTPGLGAGRGRSGGDRPRPLPPPLAAWLARRPALPSGTGLFPGSGAAGAQSSAFDRPARRLPVPPRARLSLSESEVTQGGAAERIAAALRVLEAVPRG